MSLYLKYRPQNFDTIVGQSHVVNTIKNSLVKNTVNHAYLFCGSRGTGKTSTARIIAKSLNCLNLIDGYNPCNECENCTAILENRLIDLIEIDAASNRGIDEIRELREKILFAPSQGKKKIYIIDEVHMLTKEAFNALLKTLEEPPEHAYFILATTEAHKIPETISSRCQQYSFKRIDNQSISDRLSYIAESEKIECEAEGLNFIAQLSRGGLRDAIGLLEQMSNEGKVTYDQIIELLGITGPLLMDELHQHIKSGSSDQAISVVEKVNNEGQDLSQFCTNFIKHLREKMLEQVKSGQSSLNTIEVIEIFSHYKGQIHQSEIPQLALEIACIKASHLNKKEEVKLVSPEIIKAEVENKAGNKTEVPTQKIEIEKESAKNPEATVEKITKKAPAEEVKEVVKEEVQKEDEPKKSIQSEEFKLDSIKEKWNLISKEIKTPFVRMSFISGKPVKIEGEQLYIEFQSSTLMENVNEPGNKNEIIDAFNKIFNVKPNIKVELKTLEVKTPSNSTQEVAEMAQEVFGQ